MVRSRGVSSILGVGLCLLVVAGCGSTSQDKKGPNLRMLALHLADLPPQTKEESARYWTNAQAAARDSVSAATYDRHGRIQSYTDVFARHVMNGSEPTWLLHADSEITSYRDVAGASWYYDRLSSGMRKAYVVGSTTLGTSSGTTGVHVPFQRLSVPAVGDAHVAFTADWGGDEVGYTTRVIIFRRDRYVVFLRDFGLLDQTPVREVAALGQRVDHRLKAISLNNR